MDFEDVAMACTEALWEGNPTAFKQAIEEYPQFAADLLLLRVELELIDDDGIREPIPPALAGRILADARRILGT